MLTGTTELGKGPRPPKSEVRETSRKAVSAGEGLGREACPTPPPEEGRAPSYGAGCEGGGSSKPGSEYQPPHWQPSKSWGLRDGLTHAAEGWERQEGPGKQAPPIMEAHAPGPESHLSPAWHSHLPAEVM